MGFLHLLNTNILSDLIRNPAGSAAQRLAEAGEETVCTSIVVACELRFGAEKKNSTPLRERVEELLSIIEVFPLDGEADRAYARIRIHLEARGAPIGPNDLLIAAHALSLGLTLVTANTTEFARIPDLQVENWLERTER
ncbi:MAG: type II toxin-antitoxin system VapC family toxin [Thermodesulfobacteriota bacterium]